MKIAIATIDKKEDSKISSRGGRALYYLIFDKEGKFLESISNPFAIGGGGAGIAVAQMLADKKVDVVIAEGIGENMEDALNEKGIKYYEKSGIAQEVAREIINSK